ncbi:MAG TPA: M23 family metallopeptidase [Thermoanaerobaculia bacterium]
MGKRYSTIIFVPHARARFRKLRVSHRAIFSLLSVITSSLCLSSFFSYQYFTTLSQTHELAKLRRENLELEQANEQFSRSVETLRGKLDTVEEKTRKLAIIAGVETLQSGSAGGVGGARVSDPIVATPFRDEADKMRYDSDRIATELQRLEKELTRRYAMLSARPSIAPVKGILTDGFGGRRDPFTGDAASHPAVDISSDVGRAVRSPADGTVIKAEWANGYGNVIFISHGYGHSTRYGHLSKFNVKPGDKVKRDQIIGYVGSTGRSTGPHLHYEVRLNNRPVNPLEYILDAF